MVTQPITYTPQFQPPDWEDNVDLVTAAGANGFNIQFQNLRDELDALSTIIQQLSKQISDTNNTLGQVSQNVTNAANAIVTANNTISALTNTANNALNTANTANATANSATNAANTASTTANSAVNTANTANTTANAALTAVNALINKPRPAKWGQITDSGRILAGSGDFTVSVVIGPRPNQIFYDISFNSPFPSIPAVTATLTPEWNDVTSTGASTQENIVVSGVNQNKCRITTGFYDGSPSPTAFCFIAYCSA